MARATYLAPGVYVEEVPAAQQPIAGVGTNTVGFIGVVDDTVQWPAPNPDYDPVHARLILQVAALKASGAEVPEVDLRDLDEHIKRHTEEVNRLKAEVEEKKGVLDKNKAQVATLDADIQRLEGKPKDQRSDEENNELKEKRREQHRLASEITKLTDAIGTAEQPESLLGQIAVKEGDIKEMQDVKAGKAPSNDAKQVSSLKPYILKTFQVIANPGETKLCTNFTEYTNRFGPFSADDPAKEPGTALSPGHRALTHAVSGFFKNGGTRCFVARVRPGNPEDIDRAFAAFESIDEVAIIAAPGVEASPDIWDKLVTHCETCGDRFAILDCPEEVEDDDGVLDVQKLNYTNIDCVLPGRSKNAAFYFPYIEVVDPAKQMQDLDPSRKVDAKYAGRIHVPPSGHVAGIYARTDEQRGVHKAPANAAVLGAINVKYYVSKPKQELLNPQGVNCIRNMNGNITVWGARTVGGDQNGEWKYVNVRRLFLFLAESIDEGTQWVVFEPNDRTLWGKIRRNVSAFLTNVWRNGALFGSSPEEAFYVKCDDETNPPEVRDLGQVITEIGVAIVRPAEFVIFRITQSAGRTAG